MSLFLLLSNITDDFVVNKQCILYIIFIRYLRECNLKMKNIVRNACFKESI